MTGEGGSNRITYKDIVAFREKVFEELTEIRKVNSDEFTAIRGDISEIKIEIKGQEEKFKGLIRRDTIGYVLDAFVTSIAIAIGVARNQ